MTWGKDKYFSPRTKVKKSKVRGITLPRIAMEKGNCSSGGRGEEIIKNEKLEVKS